MVLEAVRAKTKQEANRRLVLRAAQNPPTLVLDCANCTNPHVFKDELTQEQLFHIYTITIELLYTFRDALKKTPEMARKLETNTIAITTFSGLFHYQDEQENNAILKQCWELINQLAKDFHVLIAVPEKPNILKANPW